MQGAGSGFGRGSHCCSDYSLCAFLSCSHPCKVIIYFSATFLYNFSLCVCVCVCLLVVFVLSSLRACWLAWFRLGNDLLIYLFTFSGYWEWILGRLSVTLWQDQHFTFWACRLGYRKYDVDRPEDYIYVLLLLSFIIDLYEGLKISAAYD